MKYNLLNKEKKLNNEIKNKYKPILTFTFNEISKKFINFKENFLKISDFNIKDFNTNINQYKTNLLSHFNQKMKTFQNFLNKYHLEESDYIKKRKNYFDYIEKLELKKLIKFKNFKKSDSKSKLKSF